MWSRPNITRRQALRALAVAALGAPLAPLVRAQNGAGPTIHFYSPEANLNNFGTLKGEFDSFLATAGGSKFQPHSDRAAFERALENRGDLFFMSSWHFAQLKNRNALQPALIGRIRDKSTQRHLLCAKKSVASIAALKGQRVASAGNKAFTASLLADLVGADHRTIFPEQNILPVPKDFDALIAIGFGSVQAAVASESSLERLAKNNPRQHDALAQLAKGPERLLPIIVAPAAAGAGGAAVLKVLAGMGADVEGQQRLRLLGLDALVPLSDAQRQELRK